MKNKAFIRTIKILALVLPVIIYVLLSQHYVFTYHEASRLRVEGFYAEPENTIDVVLLGASDISSGFSSVYAYENYGFTSYPYTIDSAPVTFYKSQVEEIIREQNPRLIVIEINGVLYRDESFVTGEVPLRKYIDSIPGSENKYDTIFEMVEKDEAVNYLIPFVKYHGTWVQGASLFTDGVEILHTELNGTWLKGNETSAKVAPLDPTYIDVSQNLSTLPLESNSEKYLIEFLEYLKQNNIDNVVFTRFPHRVVEGNLYERFLRCNTAEKIITEYGFDFINMERNYQETGVDFLTDFRDNDHLNIYGQKKLTDYLSQLLITRYGVEKTSLSAEDKQRWDKSVEYNNLFYRYAEEQIANGNDELLNESTYLIEQLDTLKS